MALGPKPKKNNSRDLTSRLCQFNECYQSVREYMIELSRDSATFERLVNTMET